MPEKKALITGITDSLGLTRIMCAAGPDEVYNLAAQSHVAARFDAPEYTADVNAPGVSVGQVILRIDPRCFRPAEMNAPVGGASLARMKPVWSPRTAAEAMRAEMVREDLAAARRHRLPQSHGLGVPMPHGV